MPIRRFERLDDSGQRRFWEIEREGKRLIWRRGKLEGGLVDAKSRELASADQAIAEAELRVLERLRGGWHEVEAERHAPARNPALEAAIVDDPTDPAAWSVYADWLQGRGDPFGERLGLALAGELDERALEAWTWSSELRWLCEREDLDVIAALERRWGFVIAARIGQPPEVWGSPVPAQLLAALLRCPAGRLVRRLAIRRQGGQVDTLLGQRDSITLEHLRELILGDFSYPDEGELSWERVGELSRVFAACPNLRRLHVRGGGVEIADELEHAELRELTIESAGLDARVVESLARARLPKLRRLELWTGPPRQDLTPPEYRAATLDSLASLLHAPERWPCLRELGLVNAELGEALAPGLASVPLLGQLERLDLSRGTLRDAGGRALLAHADALGHLRELDLRGNFLAPELAHAIARALPGIARVEDQRDPETPDRMGQTGYYVMVDE